MDKTIENCSIIEGNVVLGVGEPKVNNGYCEGYVDKGEEPIEPCKCCKLFDREGE